MAYQDRRWADLLEIPDMVVVVAPDILLVLAAASLIDFRTAIALGHVLVLSAFADKVDLSLAAC